MAKKKYFRRKDDASAEFAKCVTIYRNRYYNAFRRQFKINGLDYRQQDYIMKKFYGSGTVAAFKIKGIDELGFAPWSMVTWDMYDLPETVNLMNEHGSPLIPYTVQKVDKDVCLGYIQRNKKPISMIVDWYIDRIAQVEMTINTNLNLHKMPFLIPIDENEDKILDIVQRILNDELVIFAEGIDPALFKAVSTAAPYIIDKLHEYKVGLENELKTYLGIDNQGAVEKREQLNLDETNANNNDINDGIEGFLDCLNEFADNIKETFGIEISFERTSKPIDAIGEYHEGEKPGPDGGEDNDND